MTAETVAGRPLVSVIVPAYNAAATIVATLASVRAQTYTAVEILVVDDGSTDATPEIVERVALDEPRLRLIRQRNSGVAHARNVAIATAEGDWIAPIDADDIWHPEKLARQMEIALASELAPALVYSWCRRIDADDRVIADQGRPTHSGMQFHQLLAFNFINNASNAIFRTDAARAVGGFEEAYQSHGAFGAEDITLYLAIAQRWPMASAPGFLIGYRTTGNGMSADPRRMRNSVELMLIDLERRTTDLPPSLLDLSRTFYDIYAASLALRACKARLFVTFLAKALMRRPVLTCAFLICSVTWRLAEEAYRRRGQHVFSELAVDRLAYSQPLWEWIDAYRVDRVARSRGHRK